MNPDRAVAGLDIGFAKTTAIIGEVVGSAPKHASIKVRGVGQARTTGIRHGVVADIDETTRSIRKALENAERMAGVQVHDVYAGIAGEHVQAMISKGIVAIVGEEVSALDVDRANDVARAQLIPADRELLHAIPQEYSVDWSGGIRDPIGMAGMRLETEMCLVTVGSTPALNVRRAVERAGYAVRELVLEPLASALAVLTEDEKELGVALIEMGAGTTEVAVFHEGKIRHVGTVGFGGSKITSDIARGLGVTQADAERLKERHGCAYEPLVDPNDIIQLSGTDAQGHRQIPRERLVHIIHHRLADMLSRVKAAIAAAGYDGRLAGGTVMTGGGAAMAGLPELVRDVFGTGVRVGIPGSGLCGLSDTVEAPRFSTVVGLAMYAAQQVPSAAISPRRLHARVRPMNHLRRRVRVWLEDFF